MEAANQPPLTRATFDRPEASDIFCGGEIGPHQIRHAERGIGYHGDDARIHLAHQLGLQGISGTAITPVGAATSPAQVTV